MMKKIIALLVAIMLSVETLPVVFAVETITAGRGVLNHEVLDGIHPRIFIDPNEAEVLRKRVIGSEDYSPYWKAVKQGVDEIIAIPPLDYIQNSNDGWMRDRVGNNLGNVAFMYVMTKDKKYYDAAEKIALAACSYPTWGRDAELNTSLAAGHILAGMGLFYDWCFDAMPENTRETVRNTIIERGTYMYKASRNPSVFWSQQWFQNHMYIHTTGMIIAGVAIMDEYPAAKQWFEQANGMFANTFKYLSDDGSNQEGPMYNVYGMQFLYMYLDLAKKFYNIDYFSHPWLKNNAKYIIYSMFPEEHWTYDINHFNLSDDEYTWNGGVGPDHYLFRIAKEYKDGYTQYFAEKIFEKGIGKRTMYWTYILWNDQDVEAVSPETMPKMQYFPDMELLYSRSDWHNNESMLMFKCGPFMGHKVNKENKTNPAIDWGGGHAHPDANHFSIFAEGDNQLVDDGYSHKYTNSHNSLLIDNKGQLGEGFVWFRYQDVHMKNVEPRIIKVESNDVYDYIVGDATTAYSKSTGLTKYYRHILFIKPDILLVVDDIASTIPRNYELRFFPYSQNSVEQPDGSFYVQNTRSKLMAKSIYMDGGDFTAENVVLYSGKANTTSTTPTISSEHLAFRAIKKDAKELVSATAFTWSGNSSVPASVTGTRNGNNFVFDVRGEKFTIDIGSLKASVPFGEELLSLYYNGKKLMENIKVEERDKEKYLPARTVLEALGGEVTWDGESGSVISSLKDKNVSFKLVQDGIIIDNDQMYLLKSEIERIFDLDIMINGNSNKVLITDYKASSSLTEIKLDEIFINKLRIKGYDPDKKEYNIVNTWGESTPEVSIIPQDISTVTSVFYEENKKIIITCRSRDGALYADYIFHITPYIGFGNIPVVALAESSSDIYIGAAMDGDMSTNSTSTGDNEWAQFDFGQERRVAAVGIAPYIGSTRKAFFEIFTSNDGESWAHIYNGGSSGTTSDFEYYDMKNTKCRYVRLLFHGNSTNLKNSFYEVAFFDTIEFASSLEIKLGKTVLRLEETTELAVKGNMFNGEPLDLKNGKLEVSVDREDIVKLEDGIISAIKKGDAVVTAKYTIGEFVVESRKVVEVSDGVFLEENFEGYTDGASISGGSWQGTFGDKANQAAIKVMHDGNKVLKVSSSMANLTTNATYMLNKSGKIVFEGDIMSDSTKGQKGLKLYDSKPALYGPLLVMNQNGDIVSYDVDREYILRTYRKNTWYHFRVEMDIDTQLVDVYINGTQYAKGIGMRAKEGNGNKYNWTNGTQGVRIDSMSQDGSSVNLYIDNLKIYELRD